MAASLKISADTSDAKKSIMDLTKTVSKVKSSNISIFSSEDKKFIKKELNQELSLMKNKLKDNQKEISKLVAEQKNLTLGSDTELKNRHKILQAYKTQAKLARDIGKIEKSRGQLGMGGGGLGGMGGMLGKLGMGMAAGGLALGALGIPLAISSTKQFMGGAPTRTRATGLGIQERTRLSPEAIAQAGLTEQQLLERRTTAAGIAGRGAGSEGGVLQQARFERAFGLEGGTLTNVMGGLRGGFGAQANQAQEELQASILASGMEDALAPYLESMTQLLANINENGMEQTTQLISALGELAAQGDRTPEQIARTFQNVQRSVQGATGEANAFLQSAFARGGIGGGNIGGTRFAMETGGITGLDQEQFSKLGFGGEGLQNQLQKMGAFSGLGQRSGAIINQFKRSAGLKQNQSFREITDPTQLFALQNLSNRIFGTEGTGGLEALSQLEKVQQGRMGREKFNEKLKEIREGKNPQVERLDKINSTLAGQTEVLTAIKDNLMEAIGQGTIGTGIAIQQADAARVRAQGEMIKTGAGAIEGGATGVSGAIDYISKGGLGSDLFDVMTSFKEWVGSTSKSSISSNNSFLGTDMSQFVNQEKQAEMIGKHIQQGVQKGMSTKVPPGIKPNIRNDIKIINSDGLVTNKTFKSK